MEDAQGGHAEILIPAAYGLPLLDLVSRWGVNERELLHDFGLTREQLAQPARWIPAATAQKIVERALELTRETGLAVFMGLELRLSTHGFLGFAAMAAPTLRAALEVAVRYACTRIAGTGLAIVERGGVATLELTDNLHRFGALRELVVTSLLASLHHHAKVLTGRDITGTIEVTFPEPAYRERLRAQMPASWRFGQAADRLVFSADVLDLPIVTADAAAFELTRARCEQALESLVEHSRGVHRVRKLLAHDGDGFRSLEDVASAMKISTRTLKRVLAAHGTSYSELVEQERHARATHRLRESTDKIRTIAAELGYADVAGFSRAFRRWTGMAPGRFRHLRAAPAAAPATPELRAAG